MRKLNKLFEKFCKADKDARIKICLKILRILAKNHYLLIWFPRGKDVFSDLKDCKDYYTKFKSERGVPIVVTLNLSGDIFDPSNSSVYEFGLWVNDINYSVELGHIIQKVELSQSARTAVMVRGTELPLKYGYLIMELYNRVANHLQTAVAQNKVRNALVETLESFKKSREDLIKKTVQV